MDGWIGDTPKTVMTTTALQTLIGKGQQHLRGITSPDKYPSFTAFAKTSYENGYT